MSHSDKKLSLLTLTSVNEARLHKRSQSISVYQFQPIKLKTLHEARLFLKSSSSLAESLPEESEFGTAVLKTTTETKSYKKSLNETLNEALEKVKLHNTVHGETTRTHITDKKNAVKSKVFQKKSRIKGRSSGFEDQNKEKKSLVYPGYSPDKTPRRLNVGINRRRVSGADNDKNVKKSSAIISDLLQSMESKVQNNKRLTKDQEKVLIERLQGRKMFKSRFP